LNISILVQNWQIQDCGIECEGLLIGISFKLFLVLLGVWALYFRKPKSTLPRIYELRALILFLLFILTFSYWLFYGVRIIDARQQDYYKILQFTATYVDVLLFIYIISVFLIEIRQLQPQYVVRIMRSPDGQQREYNIGKMSIQRAAVWLLEQYYKDFPVYNPWLENAHKRRINIDAALKTINETNGGNGKSNNSLKYYNIDSNTVGGDGDEKSVKSKQLFSIPSRGHNDRYYEEYEYERRLRKRRARLLTTTEDAFTNIKRVNLAAISSAASGSDKQQATVMDPLEAAQAIFTPISRDLRRYLRITRQQPYFTRDSILSHLADCISYDMSPKSFLQRYFNSEPLIFNQRALLNNGPVPLPPPQQQSQRVKFQTPEQSWILICDTVLYQNVEDNLMLVLKQNEISLMCTFKRLPYFNLIEDILDIKRNKFVLKMNSETSV
jgi:vang-like